LKQSGLSINETYGIILCNFFRKKLLKIKRNCLNFTIFSFIAELLLIRLSILCK
jgi:hypothetical protein